MAKAQDKNCPISTVSKHADDSAADKALNLELANKYKSEFLANMSHELRTPLNSIMLLAHYLRQNKEGNLSTDQMESLNAIYTAGKDLLTLINEILDLSKVEAGKMEINPEDMDLRAFAESICQKFKPIACNKQLDLNVIITDPAPASIQTDPHRVEQIISNFLSNAVKFTSDGNVCITIGELRDLDDIKDVFPNIDPCQYVVFSVIDTGIGIPPAKRELIFEAFQQADGTTSRQYGGTGLGLSISKKLAELLGGYICLQENRPQGSIFHLILPKAFSMDRGTASTPQNGTVLSRDNTNLPESIDPKQAAQGIDFVKDDRETIGKQDVSILIIKDTMTHLDRLIEQTKAKNFKFLIAGDGKTGLQFAEYYQPRAIILDLQQTGLSNWAVMSRLKDNRLTRHIPVCLISDNHRAIDAIKMGAAAFLPFPIDTDELDRAFGKLIRVISKPVKELLLIEDDPLQQKSIAKIIRNEDVKLTSVKTAADAFNQVLSGTFDCIVLDLGLPDMSGLDLLEKIRKKNHVQYTPVIIYTSRELTNKENALIDNYAESTIIKSANSHKKLLDETTLFLHRRESDLSSVQQKMLRELYDRKSILASKKVLLVDDDMRTVFSIKKVLENEGMKVLAGKNGREGITILENNSDIDIILTDILMPEMDGYQTISAIRQQACFKKLPIVALTVKAMAGDRTRCIEAGANDYLAKPVDADRLLSMLRVWLYE